VTLERRTRSRHAPEAFGGGVVTAIPPKTRHVILAESETYAALANMVTIHHSLGNVVSIIEIVSPGDKSSRTALRSFVEKTVDFLRHSVRVLVVDLFPPSARNPQRIHKAFSMDPLARHGALVGT